MPWAAHLRRRLGRGLPYSLRRPDDREGKLRALQGQLEDPAIPSISPGTTIMLNDIGSLTLTLMSSFILSTIQICSLPFDESLKTASSPVLMNLPSWSSTNVSLFALSFFKYPNTTLGDLTHSSPGWSYPVISFPSADMSFTSIPAIRHPELPNHTSIGCVEDTTVQVSVSPYPCLTCQLGYCFCSASAVSWPRGAAPVKIVLTDDRSYFLSRCSFFTMAMMMGG